MAPSAIFQTIGMLATLALTAGIIVGTVILARKHNPRKLFLKLISMAWKRIEKPFRKRFETEKTEEILTIFEEANKELERARIKGEERAEKVAQEIMDKTIEIQEAENERRENMTLSEIIAEDGSAFTKAVMNCKSKTEKKNLEKEKIIEKETVELKHGKKTVRDADIILRRLPKAFLVTPPKKPKKPSAQTSK